MHMQRLGILLVALLPELGLCQDAVVGKVDFDRDVRPILSDKCYTCHGPDEGQRQTELRLDVEESARADLGGYFAILPGDSEHSEIMRRISTDDEDLLMPPPESKLVITQEERETLRRWIEGGAQWSEHWAFVSPVKPEPPQVEVAGLSPIDRFVLDKLNKNGLSFSEKASRERLLSRVTMDLTGLPPSIEEIEAFLADESPQAYEIAVDRLLKTTAHAERLTLDWMDLSRYADSHGLHADGWRRMWPWRDWVIKAFQENLPYDQFVTWQLAGDLLPDAKREQILATAFHRNHPMTAEGGVIDEEYRLYYVFDRVETTATAFLGLTVGCARCHDHKFDPISQADFYRLAAFYNNVRELGMTGDDGNFGPLLQLPSDEQEHELEDLNRQIADVSLRLSAVRAAAREGYAKIEGDADFEVQLPDAQSFPFDEYRIAEANVDESSDDSKEKSEAKKKEYLDGNEAVSFKMRPSFVEAVSGKGIQVKDEYGYLSISNAGIFEAPDEFSASLWLRPEQTPDEIKGPLRTILGNAGSKNQLWRGWEWDLDPTNRLVVRMIHGLPDNLIDVRSKDSLEFQEWNHIAFSYDGSGLASGVSLYLNGRKLDTEVVIDSLSKPIHPAQHAIGFPPDKGRALRLGRSYRSFAGEFGILLAGFDDLRLFQAALTDLEVQALYASYDTSALDADQEAHTSRQASAEISAEHWLQRQNEEFKKLSLELRELRAKAFSLRGEIAEIMVLADMPQPRKTYILARGEYDQPLDAVTADTPQAVMEFGNSKPKNRLGLANWLFDKNNPLTARVAVNHYWQLMFGNGLVRTPHDFGVQGERPTHPELLDWLAVSLIEDGWDIRKLLKKIALSETYQQSSVVSKELLELDPDNRLLSRSPSYRLPAEFIRDSALAASGVLARTVGGPSVKPYQPDGLWIEKNNFSKYLMNFKADSGQDLYRRSLYTFIRRTSPPPSMIALDAPNRSVCTVKREVTNTPLQALVLLNDPQFVEAARILAFRVMQEAQSVDDRISLAFRLLTGRIPEEKEIEVLREMYESQRQRFVDSPESAESLLKVGDYETGPTDESQLPDLAAFTVLANTMMNFDEFYMKR